MADFEVWLGEGKQQQPYPIKEIDCIVHKAYLIEIPVFGLAFRLCHRILFGDYKLIEGKDNRPAISSTHNGSICEDKCHAFILFTQRYQVQCVAFECWRGEEGGRRRRALLPTLHIQDIHRAVCRQIGDLKLPDCCEAAAKDWIVDVEFDSCYSLPRHSHCSHSKHSLPQQHDPMPYQLRSRTPILALSILITKQGSGACIGSSRVDQEVCGIGIHYQQLLFRCEVKQYHSLLQLKGDCAQQITFAVEKQHVAVIILWQLQLLGSVLTIKQSHRATIARCSRVEVLNRKFFEFRVDARSPKRLDGVLTTEVHLALEYFSHSIINYQSPPPHTITLPQWYPTAFSEARQTSSILQASYRALSQTQKQGCPYPLSPSNSSQETPFSLGLAGLEQQICKLAPSAVSSLRWNQYRVPSRRMALILVSRTKVRVLLACWEGRGIVAMSLRVAGRQRCMRKAEGVVSSSLDKASLFGSLLLTTVSWMVRPTQGSSSCGPRMFVIIVQPVRSHNKQNAQIKYMIILIFIAQLPLKTLGWLQPFSQYNF